MTTLADLRVGMRARVRGVAGSDDISVRLLEMGLTPGTELQVIITIKYLFRTSPQNLRVPV